MKAIIRDATLADAPAIARVHVDTARVAYRGLLPDEHLARLSYEEREAAWQGCIGAAGRIDLVAELDGRVVGFVSAGPERANHPVYTTEVLGLYLTPECHGKGVGRQLMVALAARLVQLGRTTMLVWVLSDNPTRKFYERMGGKLIDDNGTFMSCGKALRQSSYAWDDLTLLAAMGESER